MITKKRTVIFILALVFLFLTACGSSSKNSSIDGTYRYSDGPSFTVVIAKGEMMITIDVDNSSGLYWKGTVPKKIGSSFKSVADKKALDDSLLGSGSDVKDFKVSNDSIEFVFQIMDTKTTVVARK